MQVFGLIGLFLDFTTVIVNVTVVWTILSDGKIRKNILFQFITSFTCVDVLMIVKKVYENITGESLMAGAILCKISAFIDVFLTCYNPLLIVTALIVYSLMEHVDAQCFKVISAAVSTCSTIAAIPFMLTSSENILHDFQYCTTNRPFFDEFIVSVVANFLLPLMIAVLYFVMTKLGRLGESDEGKLFGYFLSIHAILWLPALTTDYAFAFHEDFIVSESDLYDIFTRSNVVAIAIQSAVSLCKLIILYRCNEEFKRHIDQKIRRRIMNDENIVEFENHKNQEEL